MIATGTFPKPFELVLSRSAWLEEGIDAQLAERAGKRPGLALVADATHQSPAA
ncbi:transcriptional regulator [Burkholderia sp. Bp9015]|uniref:transcriptional regulator n=1 Tax=Burkholderia sp. Bp9015 TaxID=2184563 RepID=UPI000F59882D|nr:transcriptional regulator [Burkholderia sp. Bp9015]